jgi:hypothetical protein
MRVPLRVPGVAHALVFWGFLAFGGYTIAEFLNGSVRLLKDAMQRLLIVLGLDVGCLYRKIGGFKTGIAKLRKTDPHLADYLEKTRAWSEPLISVRNDLHEGWLLPKFAYKENAGAIEIEEPSGFSNGCPRTGCADPIVRYLVDRPSAKASTPWC